MFSKMRGFLSQHGGESYFRPHRAGPFALRQSHRIRAERCYSSRSGGPYHDYPIGSRLYFRNVRALQAADFLVWELRKHHTQQNEWWELPDRPSGWQQRFEHYQAWSKQRHGTRLPPARKSFEALARLTPVNGIVLDYRGLCLAHKARGGVWSQTLGR